MESANSGLKRHIADTAVELFKKDGYDNVSVNKICKAAGIYRSSFYNNFAGKDDIPVYLYASVVKDTELLMNAFVEAPNDFERMWLICERWLSIAIELGPAITASLFNIELNRNIGIFDALYATDELFMKLYNNCLAMGIARSPAKPEAVVPLVPRLICHIAYDWCRKQGDFPLKREARKASEIIFDIAPKYRWKDD